MAVKPVAAEEARESCALWFSGCLVGLLSHRGPVRAADRLVFRLLTNGRVVQGFGELAAGWHRGQRSLIYPRASSVCLGE